MCMSEFPSLRVSIASPEPLVIAVPSLDEIKTKRLGMCEVCVIAANSLKVTATYGWSCCQGFGADVFVPKLSGSIGCGGGDRDGRRGPGMPQMPKAYSNCSTTISGLDPSRSGGPHVPAPLEVKTCIFPIRLKPYTNCR